MTKYYVNNNQQSNGDHEVHESGCTWLARAQNTTYLGDFSNCQGAVAAARKIYKTSNGCAFCAKTCHTS
jgi:hypothetical protein